MTSLRIREGVRAIVLDPDERILLVRFDLPERSLWATPGGGVDPGETDHAALRRELLEEAGLADPEIGPLVWRREHVWRNGKLWDGQRERYYLVRTPPFDPEPQFTVAELEAEFVTAIRWWTRLELGVAGVVFAPSRLPALLDAFLRDGPPGEPIDVGV
jgi:8-oxo-dGTP diphosphatase